MSSRFTWRSRVEIISILLTTLIIAAALIFLISHKPMTAPTVAVFDARLQVLWAQMRKGSNTYYLPAGGNVLGSQGRLGNPLEGKIRAEIRKSGINIDTLPASGLATGPVGERSSLPMRFLFRRHHPCTWSLSWLRKTARFIHCGVRPVVAEVPLKGRGTCGHWIPCHQS